ncbi:GNAT family N-acetyltransferase [Bacillaceae bacterium Marseille-Q3522]|nr:GNAT family N-acetyltransferase [Bacillaceae bacterium Marseille-Q3522]
MKEVELILFTVKYLQKIENYRLDDVYFTGYPIDAIKESREDSSRYPVLILVGEEIAGFFVLHGWSGAQKYSDNRHALLLRTFSIDNRYRKMGYAKQAMQKLDRFVKEHFPDVTEIVLGVNHANLPAQQLYLQSGFQDSGKRVIGKKGEQFVFHKMLYNK